jgi:hypothetical protein
MRDEAYVHVLVMAGTSPGHDDVEKFGRMIR